MATAPTDVGRNLRRLRLQKKLTQQQLADMASLTRPAVTQIETGVRSPRQSTAESLARALGVTVADLHKPRPRKKAAG